MWGGGWGSDNRDGGDSNDDRRREQNVEICSCHRGNGGIGGDNDSGVQQSNVELAID